MIEIGPNIYEHDLLGLFWGYEPKDEEDGKVYALLSRVCRAWVIDRNRDKEHELLCDNLWTKRNRGLSWRIS